MKKFLVVLLFVIGFGMKAQILNKGDITLSPNIGVPHVSATILKTALKVYYKSNLENKYEIGVKNTPVFNFKGEYSAQNDVSIGLAASYWRMDVDITDLYSQLNATTSVVEAQIDNTTISIKALALGFRGNYHFMADDNETKWDPYIGGTFGLTRYETNIIFKSTVLGKQLPDGIFKFKSGIGTYFSTTVGVRYYFVKNFGINAEFGWDRGALLFGGIVIKFSTKSNILKTETNNK